MTGIKTSVIMFSLSVCNCTRVVMLNLIFPSEMCTYLRFVFNNIIVEFNVSDK